MTGLCISAKQIALRWRPALRQTHVIDNQRFTVQVRQYLLDHQRVLDAGDDFHAAAADTARFDVDIEHPLKRCAQLIAAWLATGVASDAATVA